MQNNKMLDKYLGNNKTKDYHKAHKYVTKILLSIIILLASLIVTSLSSKANAFYKKYVLEQTFSFMEFRNLYGKISGVIPKNTNDSKDQMVMSDMFSYEKKEKYLDGEKYINIDNNIISSIESGIVIYQGEKEGYGKTIIIQGSNGYDIWYGNLKQIDISIYDYVKKGSIIGSSENDLYLVITKDNKYYTYEEYLNEVS